MPDDRELEALRLAAEQDPGDRRARTRYVSELIRAGRGEEAKALMLNSYLCPKAWSELVPEGPGRRCDECQEIVHEVYDAESLRRLAGEGQCAAAPPSVLVEYTDQLIRQAAAEGATLPEPSCVLELSELGAPARAPVPGGYPRPLPPPPPEPVMGAMPPPPSLLDPDEPAPGS